MEQQTPLAIRLTCLRRRAQLSLSALARQSGMQRNTLWAIETGRTPHPRCDHIVALARVLGVSTDTLLGLDRQEAPDAAGALRSPAAYY